MRPPRRPAPVATGCSRHALRRLGGEPLFKRELPLLVAELMRLPATNSVIFTAANNCLQTIVAHSTSSRMMGIVAEVCKNRHNHRLRARAVDCALQMMLQWPVSKLRKHDFELEEVMRSGCTDSNAANYLAAATVSSGSCRYVVYGCTLPSSPS